MKKISNLCSTSNFFTYFVECSLQAVWRGLWGAGRLMRVSSGSITQQNVRKTFCANNSWQREQDKGLTDKFDVLTFN